jgi:hypothetical protein
MPSWLETISLGQDFVDLRTGSSDLGAVPVQVLSVPSIAGLLRLCENFRMPLGPGLEAVLSTSGEYSGVLGEIEWHRSTRRFDCPVFGMGRLMFSDQIDRRVAI